MSPEARENYESLYGALWEEWQARVKKARPKLQLDAVTRQPVEWVAASSGDLASAALKAGLVDKLGSRVDFGERVKQLAGEDPWDNRPGTYAYSELESWLADNPADTDGKPIGVITVAGEIVDGEAGPGTAGGDRIAALLDDALEDDLAGLVVRVDSPGGSVLASEEIRRAILRHKARDIPIAVSMANVAASGGYWVSTPADRIFAEPETITGSIGIFAVIPTFEDAAQEWGINADGVRTTPLSGQPDLVDGFTPEVDAILQAAIEDGYNDFLTRVAQARKMTNAQVDGIGQGRVWDGGTARQIGLVDQYGGVDDALEWVAKQAGLEQGEWHASWLGDDIDPYETMLQRMIMGDDAREATGGGGDLFAMVARREQALLGTAMSDAQRLLGRRGMQIYCLECPSPARPSESATAPQGWFARLASALLH